MFEQTFKNIDDILYKDSGADSELDYIGQTSWVMFLRYLDELEQDKADEAALQGKDYKFIIDEEYRWPVWAMPKTDNGKLDIHKSMTGPDLVQFVDHKLFPYLAGFKLKADNPQTIEYKIGEIFSELKNKIQSGYNLREIIELADELPFRTSKDKHELSHLYESKIKNMGNAGRNGGQYYTPRPLIRAMIEVTKPKIGERIYDGACGSCGFLCETFEYLTKDREKLSTTDLQTLQTKTFYGKEKKNLAYVIGIMNMILHGIEAPNIIHTNTLSENIRDIQDKDRYNVILANPPFGGKERPEVQQNFDIKTGETAFLFLQHFIKNLKAGGRAAIVIKNTFLSNTDNASITLRKYLLETCNLHTVLDMPSGTFTGAGVKTVILFFEKGESTKKVWFYQLDPERSMGKSNSLNDDDMKEFIEMQNSFSLSDKSWFVNISEVSKVNYDLSVINPNKPIEVFSNNSKEILDSLISLDIEVDEIIENIKSVRIELNDIYKNKGNGWVEKKFSEVCTLKSGTTISEKLEKPTGEIAYLKVADMNFPGNENRISTSSRFVTKKDINEKSIFPIGTIIFPKRGGAIATNKKRITDIPIIADLNIMGAIAYPIISSEYLFYYFKKFNLTDIANGTTIPQINNYSFDSLKISFPESLEEQNYIVSRLDILSAESYKLRQINSDKDQILNELNKTILNTIYSNDFSKIDIPV